MTRVKKQQRVIFVSAIALAVLIFGILAYGLLDAFVFRPNQPVAQVGEQSVSIKQFQRMVRFSRWQTIDKYNQTAAYSQLYAGVEGMGTYIEQQLTQIQTQLEDPQTIGEQVLTQMIEQAAVEQEAKKRNITLSNEEIEERVQQAFGFFKNGTPTSESSPTAYSTSTLSPIQLTLIPPTVTATTGPTETPTTAPTIAASTPTAAMSPTPASTATAYTLDGFQKTVKDYISKQPTGTKLSEEDLREVIKAELLRKKVFDVLTADVAHEEEQVWARHILVKDEAAAQDVLKRLQNGEEWAKIAAEVSQDTSNKDKGGDLGWFGKGTMAAEFEQAAYALKVGEISPPVKTSFGYHIIQVMGHEVRILSDSEFQSARQKKFDAWLKVETAPEKVQKFDLWKKIVPTEPTLKGNLAQ